MQGIPYRVTHTPPLQTAAFEDDRHKPLSSGDDAVSAGNKDLEQQLATIANLSMPDLLEHWHALGLGEPPRLSLPLMQRLLAQLVQEKVCGGLPASAMRKLDAISVGLGTGVSVGPLAPSASYASSRHSTCPTGAYSSPSLSLAPSPLPSSSPSPSSSRGALRALHTSRASRPTPLRQVTLATGTRLVREWNGRTISVDVVGDGFVWNDVRYRSLSEIARTVTGTRWSGPRFFGIAGRG
jgi:hypothetical protein